MDLPDELIRKIEDEAMEYADETRRDEIIAGADLEKCQHEYHLVRYCGADVCDHCGEHKGMDRCFCGWSRYGGDGRAELEEMGEQIDEEP